MADIDIAGLRLDYRHAALGEGDVAADPTTQFGRWFEDTVAAGVVEPNAMTLATVGPDGQPSARVVLLKGYGPAGFTFYSNYESRKGRELDAEPRAAVVFLWKELERQVRIEGRIVRVGRDETETYFRSRPRGSQIGASVSPQSRPVAGREVLEESFAAAEARFAGEEVPVPGWWGGYRLAPTLIEFWQGRTSRLHDRLVYRPDGRGGWAIERLAP
ncbi:MAG: pyridoxamine 5'-phosphate oxidase [Chloroflexota bacterium]|nr:pyridoxamine 5'-phosphate oxidase [Chloroflexia bacterium]MDQ3167417.1 pyridoxamine 5'-phosphate oxidase [Chloroflexota bacterium]MDQ3514171.1 pyridoxamine 5'-phosphate oxidase [Chloroflexota bacterium]